MIGPINLSFPCKDGVGVLTIGHDLAARIVALADPTKTSEVSVVQSVINAEALRRQVADATAAKEELARVLAETRRMLESETQRADMADRVIEQIKRQHDSERDTWKIKLDKLQHWEQVANGFREQRHQVVAELEQCRADIATLQDANDATMKERDDARAKLAITQSDRAEQQRVALESEKEAESLRAKLAAERNDIHVRVLWALNLKPSQGVGVGPVDDDRA
jgi:chromosome segregation ATPase